jgi:hypothetical protein
MERPDRWIVLRPLQDNVRRSICVLCRTNQLHIPPLGIVGVQDSAVPVAKPFRKNVEVVSMKLQCKSAMAYLCLPLNLT